MTHPQKPGFHELTSAASIIRNGVSHGLNVDNKIEKFEKKVKKGGKKRKKC